MGSGDQKILEQTWRILCAEITRVLFKKFSDEKLYNGNGDFI